MIRKKALAQLKDHLFEDMGEASPITKDLRNSTMAEVILDRMVGAIRPSTLRQYTDKLAIWRDWRKGGV